MKSNITQSPLQTYNAIPSKWPTFNGEMYNTLPAQRHYEDGFRDIVRPQYNTETHKLGSLIISGDSVTYQVIALTPEEMEQRQQEALDSDESATKLAYDIANGEVMYQRMFAYLQRQYDNGQLTALQAKNCAVMLWIPLLPINYGQFIVAQINLNNVVPPANAKELAVLNMVKQEISNYLTNS